LHKRVEYLSLAVGNAKSQLPVSSRQGQSSSGGESVEFITNIEEKLEVAQVQIEIYRAIEEYPLADSEKLEWLAKLGDGLLTISEVRVLSALPSRYGTSLMTDFLGLLVVSKLR
jgi:nuclear pore complex protein Nup155